MVLSEGPGAPTGVGGWHARWNQLQAGDFDLGTSSPWGLDLRWLTAAQPLEVGVQVDEHRALPTFGGAHCHDGGHGDAVSGGVEQVAQQCDWRALDVDAHVL